MFNTVMNWLLNNTYGYYVINPYKAFEEISFSILFLISFIMFSYVKHQDFKKNN